LEDAMGAGFEAISGPGMHFFWSLQLIFKSVVNVQ